MKRLRMGWAFAIACVTAGCGSPHGTTGLPAPALPPLVSAATSSEIAPAERCRPIFYKPRGAPKPEHRPLHGPGLVLGGGGLDVKGEFVWIRNTIAGNARVRTGDLVVLRATGNNDYDPYIYRIAHFHSVRTLRIPTCSSAQTLAAAAAIVQRAGAVWFAGGNQADYVIWKNTPIQLAVDRVYARGGVVGGTSAGEAILGQYVFNAVAEGDRNTKTENAVRNPWERIISFTYGFFRFPALRRTITDQHFVTRNRFGRTAVFMARQIAAGRVPPSKPVVLGIGVDEESGIVVDRHGIGTLLLQGTGGSAFLIRGGAAKQIVPGLPFVSSKLVVTKLSRQGDTFDFNTWCGPEATYDVRVDGTQPEGSIYTPKDPYKPPKDSRIPRC
ncbi:MAG TPA: cyanophycinase [Candidatus Cybelea sp.]|nr:cyanophycinase [Candidatus Cybelea sp.]